MRSMGCYRFTLYRAVGGALFAIVLTSLCATASGVHAGDSDGVY